MPKDSRSRTLAVRAVMAETGLPYTRAAHELDRRTGAAPRPDGGQQLRWVPFLLSFTAPAAADRQALAQDLADQLHTLRRAETGEEYEGRADVFVPKGPWSPEPDLAGHVAGILLVRAWAVRPWDRPGEWEAVVSDFLTAAVTWLGERHPAARSGRPAALPLGAETDQVMASTAEFTAHTAGAHEALPEGWDELIATRNAERHAPGAPAAPATAEAEPVTSEGVILVPNARGGDGKTVTVDLDGQGNLTEWAPEPPIGPLDPVERPYRVVDREFQGWHERGDGLYVADGGVRRGLEDRSYQVLAATRGPVRPVEPATQEECTTLEAALAGAGRKAAASLLVALYRLVLAEAVADRESGELRRGGAQYRVMAGREGSWESTVMVRLAWDVGAELAEKPKRYDEAAVEEIVRVVTGWVYGPARYVEVAAGLAGEFSAVADRAGGWEAVADRYLQRHQRVGHPDHVVERVQHYLMSQSRTPTFG
ncbi:hypothetical protein [Streptomyces filamentosus]|uniref:hypothetical protein n=1 Tax=Streptomyces filamentosus TaxID=67294 RepID=UPI0033DA9970